MDYNDCINIINDLLRYGVIMKKVLIVSLIIFINFFVISCCYAAMVVYNTKTGKYHSPSCQWAKKCTVNCIKIDKQEAIRRGGIPCKVCGGG